MGTHLHLARKAEGHRQWLKFLVRHGIHGEGAWLMTGGFVIHPNNNTFKTLTCHWLYNEHRITSTTLLHCNCWRILQSCLFFQETKSYESNLSSSFFCLGRWFFKTIEKQNKKNSSGFLATSTIKLTSGGLACHADTDNIWFNALGSP